MFLNFDLQTFGLNCFICFIARTRFMDYHWFMNEGMGKDYLVGLCKTSMSGGWKGTESKGCKSFGYLFYLPSLDMGKEPIHCTNGHGASAALHPFQPHGMITENWMMWIFLSRMRAGLYWVLLTEQAVLCILWPVMHPVVVVCISLKLCKFNFTAKLYCARSTVLKRSACHVMFGFLAWDCLHKFYWLKVYGSYTTGRAQLICSDIEIRSSAI